MSKTNSDKKPSIRLSWQAFVFCAAGVFINIAGSQIAASLNLPIFLDSIGTILVAATGGYLPGVIVGYVSNLINGLNNPENSYYAVLSVLIAVCAAYYSERGYFEKYRKTLLIVFPMAMIGGGLGSVLTYLIKGFGMGMGVTSTVAEQLLNGSPLGSFVSQFAQDMPGDVLDKIITLTIVFLVLKLISPELRDRLHFHGWQQAPLTVSEQKTANKSMASKFSLKSKIMALIGVATMFIAGVTTGISFFLYRQATVHEHTVLAEGVANLVSIVVDGDKIDKYLQWGEAMADYGYVEEQLQQIRSTSEEILYVYVYRIMEDGCHVVFDLDTESVQGGNPGDIVEFDESFMPYLDDLLAGKKIKPLVTNEKFGWLLTVYEPIKDSHGVTQAYACVDISMVQVALNEISFLTKVLALFFGFFIMILTIGLWIAEYNLILPINTMAIAANDFADNMEVSREDSVERFRRLDIKTGDEIENLYRSFNLTIKETVEYIANIQEQSQVISKMQNGLILVLADMVESRDKNTGDHVRKTAAYCRIILEQLRKDGEFKDQLTDEFINDVVNSAPLHDIGKIKVSDVILNKPGKLTDEEFEEMKKHTIAGHDILEQAMELVSSDTGYLKEAENLATYHHEKWNGKGYPTGLSGEDIPLSARIMAVADVFDALVSTRSYKKPFTFEEAIKIIEEGSGTHFDPRVVKAFLEAKDEARRISEQFLGNTQAIKVITEEMNTNRGITEQDRNAETASGAK